MRNFLLCVLVLALDVAFALTGAKTLSIPAFAGAWSGVPLSVWSGIGGVVFLVLMTFAISMFAFRGEEAKR